MFSVILNTICYNPNSYCLLLLGFIAVYGDFIVNHTKLHLFQALFDNATHASVGAISWFIVCLNCRSSNSHPLIEIVLCAFIASIIDVDHFIVAKSWHLKDAIQLQSRPPFHCSTFPLIFCAIMIFLNLYLAYSDIFCRLVLIIFTAFASHHTRDATRRGYWFWPFGSTAPVPYFGYILLTCIIPYYVCWLYCFVSRRKLNFSAKNNLSVI